MLLENINCQYIEILSKSFEEGHRAGVLKELQITAKYNDKELITKNIDLTTLQNSTWKVEFESDTQVYIKQIYAKNIFSDVLFPLLPIPIISSDINSIIDQLISSFITILNFPNVTVTSSYTTTGIRLNIIGLPYNIVMDKMVLTLLNAEKYEIFTCGTDNTVIVNSNSVYLQPAFFGLDTFADGIYSISTIVTTNDNLAIEESTCFFYDCTMSGLLQLHVDLANCSSHETHLLLLHYSLIQASNNACNCNHMYDIYKYLADNINDIITEDCGC